MSLECLQDTSNHYEKLFESGRDYDVIIYVSENENVKEEIRAHSLILSTMSQYFCTELSKENIEKKDGKIILKRLNISPKLYKMIIRFIYCGRINLTTLDGPELLKLLTEIEKLNIHSLIPKIEEYLIKNQSEFLHQDPVRILETVYQHESFTNLWNFCLETICEGPEMLFNSDKFIKLKPSLLEQLLKRDDLNLDEIDIWNSLLKWSLAQNPSISPDSTKWNKEEITIMERTLHRFISLIRFYHMSPEDFVDKICPLKELLPKDLVNNLITFYVTPNRKANIDIHPHRKPKQQLQQIDSVIIKPEHFAIFASWIDKKKNLHYNVKNIPYKFQLLYRNNRDGNTAAAFHNKCDNKGATIVIAKITNSEQMLGGYNSLYWDSNNAYKSAAGAFLFSFTNRNNLQTAKVGYDNVGQNYIYCHQAYGPTFGSGHDLSFQYNNTTDSVSYNPSSYNKIDIPVGNKSAGYNTIYVEDYKVFQIIKNN